jgi:glycyl-tRNA synthetase
MSVSMEQLVSLCKRRGFVFQGSEIYGGLAGTWDYGPLGVALKNNIKNLWWKQFVDDRTDMYGVDAAILMNQKVWQASGHVGGFSDPMIECESCRKRFRTDQLVDKKVLDEIILYVNTPEVIERLQKIHVKEIGESENRNELIEILKHNAKNALRTVEATENQTKLAQKYLGQLPAVALSAQKTSCPNCGAFDKWSDSQQFNMMFKTNVGVIESNESVSYLRPETAQGMFVNFKNILDAYHPKLPFGLAQIGKAFRNEIAPRDFIFRVREFEQMEIEYFVDSRDREAINRIFGNLYEEQMAFLESLGISSEHIHKIEVSDTDRAHYSKRSIDTEFDFPFGQKELLGLAYRTNFDLEAHTKASGVDLSYFDEETKERVMPHCIEPTFGVDRLVLAVLTEAYREDGEGDDTRVYLKFAPAIAPVKMCVSPLLKNKPELVSKAREVFMMLKKTFGRVAWDDNGNIGKRYRRQDEIGTPFCITIDFDTLGETPDQKDTVTVRDRDTGAQTRLAIADLEAYLSEKLQ